MKALSTATSVCNALFSPFILQLACLNVLKSHGATHAVLKVYHGLAPLLSQHLTSLCFVHLS